MRRADQRRGFLVSAIGHLMLLMALGTRTIDSPQGAVPPAERPPERQRVFLPPPEVLRQLAPRPAAPLAPRPAAPAPAAPPDAKDRISVGPPVEARQKGPLLLRREDDLTAVAKGRPDGRQAAPEAQPPRPAPTPAPARTAQSGPVEDRTGPGASAGLAVPAGRGRLPTGREGAGVGREGQGGSNGTEPASITSSLQDLDRQLQEAGALGLPTGTGRQMGPLFFDPEGADFTLWLNHFKNEVYRNWIAPQAALLGFRGHVEIEFTVERDGRMTGLRILKTSGTASLDRAAEYALRGSRLLPLPADYRPPRVPMRVTFYYNELPRPS